MENKSDNAKKSLSKHQLLKLVFFYLIIFIAFCAAFYKALHVSDVKMASLLFATAFLSFVFANYSEFEMISALGFKIKKFDKITSEAESLVQNLKFQTALLVDEMISAKIEMNRYMDVNLRWKQLQDFRNFSNNNNNFDYSDAQIKKIKGFFYFDYIYYRFRKLLQAFIEEIHQEFNKFQATNFPDPVVDINFFNEFIEVKRKVIEQLELPKFDGIDYSSFHAEILTDKIDFVLAELSKFNLRLSNIEEFNIAIEELKKVLKSPDVLSDHNLELMEQAYKSRM